ncbi:uncharacterized protein FIBRA_02482 [Fibroporia radiculosa]|uniref:Uncharacterized protein n=1 Tax=Fibroporia radiculosa TaxID=599839 RepID=J4GMW7_9APHY|nr:uncharacterized protein FIBRA_02482 [Fibroporia radiculosa]CCM00450.1 predicted protein [Fibroporia radiculosa]
MAVTGTAQGTVDFKEDGTLTTNFTTAEVKLSPIVGRLRFPNPIYFAPAWTTTKEGSTVKVQLALNSGSSLTINVPETAIVSKTSPNSAHFNEKSPPSGSFALN